MRTKDINFMVDDRNTFRKENFHAVKFFFMYMFMEAKQEI